MQMKKPIVASILVVAIAVLFMAAEYATRIESISIFPGHVAVNGALATYREDVTIEDYTYPGELLPDGGWLLPDGGEEAPPADGGAFLAEYSLVPVKSVYFLTCDDPNTCVVGISESGVLNGQQLSVINAGDSDGGSNDIVIEDTADVVEAPGDITLGKYDSACFLYVSDRWVTTSTTDN